MVARITIPKTLIATLNYNEKKVQKGVAVCLSESNFLMNLDKMNFYHKLNGFENRNSLNTRAGTKTIHISLNFDPSENLSDQKVIEIANTYMQKMGFENQPYLVYRHHDAGHPHIHIVSSLIRDNGTRINTHNIGKDKSEIARKEIETQFGLVKAERQTQVKHFLKPVDLRNIRYGKTDTMKAISSVLNEVIRTYNYTSLPELNASLKQFHVIADRGNPDGIIFRKRGLMYSLIDGNGNKMGIPIKASRFSGKPTLDYLENCFAKNMLSREPLKQALKATLEIAFSELPRSVSDLISILNKMNVNTVLRQNGEGRLYGITFVDNENRSVFNGSELGKGYSIAALLKRFTMIQTTDASAIGQEAPGFNNNQAFDLDMLSPIANLIDELFTPNINFENTPYHLKKKKRKRKKK